MNQLTGSRGKEGNHIFFFVHPVNSILLDVCIHFICQVRWEGRIHLHYRGLLWDRPRPIADYRRAIIHWKRIQ